MNHPPRSLGLTPVLALACLTLMAGCADNRDPLGVGSADERFAFQDGIQPSSRYPERGRSRANLRNIWPNEDGRSWTYRINHRTWDQPAFRVYPTEAEVPAPSLDVVAALLRNHPIGTNPLATTAGYRMKFNGMKTTFSGAVGQNLETEVFDFGTGAARIAIGSSLSRETLPTGFLNALAIARPDLREKIARRWPEVAARAAGSMSPASVPDPIFLFGYAWVKTPEFIGSYGDLNLDVSWKYLVADLDPGSEFSMQPVPDLADDVFLHARVLRRHRGDRRRDEGRANAGMTNAVEVLYVVDFGSSFATDEDGNELGFTRFYSYGTITYVPHVGPIRSYERSLVQSGRPLDPGLYEMAIRLRSVTHGRRTDP